MAISKVQLSGSTDGRPVKVAAIATPGTLIHTATSTVGELDEVWLYITNTSATDETAVIEVGGVTSPDDLIKVGVTARNGLLLALPGIPMDGGVIVRVFAETTANVLNVVGFVNRIAP